MSRFSRIINVEELKIQALDNQPGKSIAASFVAKTFIYTGDEETQPKAGAKTGASPPAAGRRSQAEGPGRGERGRMMRSFLRLLLVLVWVLAGAPRSLPAQPARGATPKPPPAAATPQAGEGSESPGQRLLEQDEASQAGRDLHLRPRRPA